MSQLRSNRARLWNIKHARNDHNSSWSGMAGGKEVTRMFLERRLDVLLGLGCHPEEFDLYSFFQYKVAEGLKRVSPCPQNSVQDDSLATI